MYKGRRMGGEEENRKEKKGERKYGFFESEGEVTTIMSRIGVWYGCMKCTQCRKVQLLVILWL